MAIVEDVRIIELPKFLDARGNLSFVEHNNHIPFEIKRTYWIYDVPGGEARGGHAFRENEEFIVALSGAFNVVVDDGNNKKSFTLNRSYYGLFVPAGLWRELAKPMLKNQYGQYLLRVIAEKKEEVNSDTFRK